MNQLWKNNLPRVWCAKFFFPFFPRKPNDVLQKKRSGQGMALFCSDLIKSGQVRGSLLFWRGGGVKQVTDLHSHPHPFQLSLRLLLFLRLLISKETTT